MASVLGVLVEDNGTEYLVAADNAGLPDIRRRDPDGHWVTLKFKGPGGRGGWTAQALLAALGSPVATNHTQQQIKKLVLLCMTRLTNQFFEHARW